MVGISLVIFVVFSVRCGYCNPVPRHVERLPRSVSFLHTASVVRQEMLQDVREDDNSPENGLHTSYKHLRWCKHAVAPEIAAARRNLIRNITVAKSNAENRERSTQSFLEVLLSSESPEGLLRTAEKLQDQLWHTLSTLQRLPTTPVVSNARSRIQQWYSDVGQLVDGLQAANTTPVKLWLTTTRLNFRNQSEAYDNLRKAVTKLLCDSLPHTAQETLMSALYKASGDFVFQTEKINDQWGTIEKLATRFLRHVLNLFSVVQDINQTIIAIENLRTTILVDLNTSFSQLRRFLGLHNHRPDDLFQILIAHSAGNWKAALHTFTPKSFKMTAAAKSKLTLRLSALKHREEVLQVTLDKTKKLKTFQAIGYFDENSTEKSQAQALSILEKLLRVLESLLIADKEVSIPDGKTITDIIITNMRTLVTARS